MEGQTNELMDGQTDVEVEKGYFRLVHARELNCLGMAGNFSNETCSPTIKDFINQQNSNKWMGKPMGKQNGKSDTTSDD